MAFKKKDIVQIVVLLHVTYAKKSNTFFFPKTVESWWSRSKTWRHKVMGTPKKNWLLIAKLMVCKKPESAVYPRTQEGKQALKIISLQIGGHRNRTGAVVNILGIDGGKTVAISMYYYKLLHEN